VAENLPKIVKSGGVIIGGLFDVKSSGFSTKTLICGGFSTKKIRHF